MYSLIPAGRECIRASLSKTELAVRLGIATVVDEEIRERASGMGLAPNAILEQWDF
jgi:hypothetical protein